MALFALKREIWRYENTHRWERVAQFLYHAHLQRLGQDGRIMPELCLEPTDDALRHRFLGYDAFVPLDPLPQPEAGPSSTRVPGVDLDGECIPWNTRLKGCKKRCSNGYLHRCVVCKDRHRAIEAPRCWNVAEPLSRRGN
jgi:hypothetical protein